MATLFVVYEYDSKVSAVIGTGSRAVKFLYCQACAET